MKRWDESLPNNHHLVIGASGSGKTTFTKRHELVKSAKRILIWDPDGTYKVPHVQTVAQFHRVAVKNSDFGPIRVSLSCTPNVDDFEQFCAIAFALAHCRAPLTVIVEEAADVARIGKASPQWGQLSRRGRKFGVSIFLCSQRPQEIDKTFIGQAGYVWCGRLKTKNDARYMADVLDVSQDDVQRLNKLEYFYRHEADEAVRGKLTF